MQTVPRGAGGEIPRPLFVAERRRRAGWLAAVGFVLISVVSASADPLLLAAKTTVCRASWYGEEFARRPTASGERFDPHKLTGAHRTLPLGSKVRVTNLHNGRSVLIVINDRGPYVEKRGIDLSYGAARQIGMLRRGIARVRLELVES
jgi:rare lipoprotein A (peptidoglycan hydrolase)